MAEAESVSTDVSAVAMDCLLPSGASSGLVDELPQGQVDGDGLARLRAVPHARHPDELGARQGGERLTRGDRPDGVVLAVDDQDRTLEARGDLARGVVVQS